MSWKCLRQFLPSLALLRCLGSGFRCHGRASGACCSFGQSTKGGRRCEDGSQRWNGSHHPDQASSSAAQTSGCSSSCYSTACPAGSDGAPCSESVRCCVSLLLWLSRKSGGFRRLNTLLHFVSRARLMSATGSLAGTSKCRWGGVGGLCLRLQRRRGTRGGQGAAPDRAECSAAARDECYDDQGSGARAAQVATIAGRRN